MKEAAWAIGILMLFVLVGLARAVAFIDLLNLGQLAMYGGAALGVPMELFYFALLGSSLTRTGRRPAGWYWRPFHHHHLLTRQQRTYVLPFYYVGALSFALASLGILVVLIALASLAMG